MREKIVFRDKLNGSLIVNFKNKIYINNLLLFPDRYKQHKIQFTINHGYAIVFYSYKYSHSLLPLKIPIYSRINEDFMVGLGIYLAEGSRNRRSKITNSEPLIIDQAVKFFKLLGVRKSTLSAWIQLHERSTKNQKEVISFWISNTFLKPSNITGIRTKKSAGNGKIKEFGTLHLEANSILFQLLITGLLNNLSKILSNIPKEYILFFLRGAFAGEGSPNITRTGSLNMVTYTSKREEERILIANLLYEFGVVSRNRKNKYDVCITGYKNLGTFVFLDLFRYHVLRKKKLICGFKKLRKSKIPGLNKEKIIFFLLKNKTGSFTASEIQRRFSFSYRNTIKHLNGLYAFGNIKKIEGAGPIPHKWAI